MVYNSNMPYKLQLKPYQGKNGEKYKIIQITDLTLHTNNMRPTQKVAKKIGDAMEKQEPGRIYSNIEKQDDTELHSITMTLLRNDPEFVKMVQEEERKGYKILISFPKTGIPMLLGKDAKEFIDSTKGKRILRHLAKKKSQE